MATASIQDNLKDRIIALRGSGNSSPRFRRDTPEEIKAIPLLSDEARAAIAGGWRTAWSFFFDRPGMPLVSRMAPHHRRAVKWHWRSRHRICRSQLWEQDQRAGFVNANLTEDEFDELVKEFLET